MQQEKFKGNAYVQPTIELLEDYPVVETVGADEMKNTADVISHTLKKHGILCSFVGVSVGAAATCFDLEIESNKDLLRALKCGDELAIALGKRTVYVYINYSRGGLSVKVPNDLRRDVGLKSLLSDSAFEGDRTGTLKFVLGTNIDGKAICPDITRMPHLLIAGTTGSGKSICLNVLLLSMLYKYSPEELKFIIIDPKQVEFTCYNKLPHMLADVISDPDKSIRALDWAIAEMERRYELFKQKMMNGKPARCLEDYNINRPDGAEKLPKIVILIDEFSDLMLYSKRETESKITCLAQKSRACGIHLVIATQRPSVDNLTGVIKSNFPSRIAFKVMSAIDSRIILDADGAERLLGKGDMLLRTCGERDVVNVQGCYVGIHEVQKVTDFVKANNQPCSDSALTEFLNKTDAPAAPADSAKEDGKTDDIFIKALKLCVDTRQASVSMLQRRFPVGYIRACKIIDWMEEMHFITPPEGIKPRRVLLTAEEFFNMFGDIAVGEDGVFKALSAKPVQASASVTDYLRGDELDGDVVDKVFIKALKCCITLKQASAAIVQRRFPVGYIQACKIIGWMESMEYITPYNGSKPSTVLLTMEEFIEIYGEVDD